MYHLMKDDPWGNKIPVMSISSKHDVETYLERHRTLITRIVEVPRNKQSLILM
ncbi:MAG: hypothetical protein J5732_02535 [Bacteroidaceae bacterium]|nr:hypothetical protein [Bacteroidaceae bacterium]